MTTARKPTPVTPTSPASPIRLSDAALLLLGQAAARHDRLLLPPPATLRARGSALQKVLQALLKAALVIEVPVDTEVQSWRVGEDDQRMGLSIAAEGFRAIGLPVPAPPARQASEPAASTATAPTLGQGGPSSTGRTTKQATLIALLSGKGGASIVGLAETLAWQNHTVRAALTGLRQKGHVLAKSKDEGGTTLYRITGQARAAVTAGA